MTTAATPSFAERQSTLSFGAAPRSSAAPFLLSRGPYPDRPELWSLNLDQSDVTRESGLFADSEDATGDLADRLAVELDFRRDRPKLILIGPEIEPFSSNAEAQREIVRVVRLLAARGIVAWLSTRAVPKPEMLDALAENRDFVRVTVSLTTLDPELQSAIEPESASSDERLTLIAELGRRDIPFEVNLDPLLPGLTDTHDKLWMLLERLAAAEVHQITAGYLVLRPGLRERFEKALEPLDLVETVMGAYHDGTTFRDGPNAAAVYLSKAKRQRGYAALMALASEFGIVTRLSSLANPDFRPPRPPDTANSPRARALLQSLRQSSQNVRAVGA